MTQEEKELLLKDLCARLPYGVMAHYFSIAENSYIDTELLGYYNGFIHVRNSALNPEVIKPYLRPMSSMTEEELNEYENFITNEKDDQIRFCNELTFYNSHHFDYRGLIPMKLAIEVTEENNPYKE